MAVGFKISVDLGQEKPSFTVASSTAGTAGLEVNIDPAKFKDPHQVDIVLERVAELIRESVYPPA